MSPAPPHLHAYPWYLPHQAWRAAMGLTHHDPEGAEPKHADLTGADLTDATMPDGRTLEQWQADPLAGLCDSPEATERAVAAWGAHTWRDCPMHSAHGWGGISDAPADRRALVATFVALFDGRHLPKPEGP